MKERIITRTIEVSVCEVMCLNTATAEVEVKTFEIYGKGDTPALLKAIKSKYETDDFKCVHIAAVEHKETLYGMSESDFIAHATVLRPRGSKE